MDDVKFVPAPLTRIEWCRLAVKVEQLRTAKALADAALDAVIAREEAALERDRAVNVSEFAALEKARGGKNRTFTAFDDPALAEVGSVSLRKSPDRLVYDDPTGAFFAWAAAGSEEDRFVRVKIKAVVGPKLLERIQALFGEVEWFTEREPVRSEAAAHHKATGEIPPGFSSVPGKDSIVVAAAAAEEKGRKEKVALATAEEQKEIEA